MLLCTILLNHRRSGIEVEVFGEKLVQKKWNNNNNNKTIIET